MGVATSQTKSRQGDEIDAQVREVLTLLATVMRGMKKGGGPKHEEVKAAFEAGELNDRHIAPLLALTMAGPLSVGELAGQLGLTPGTTSMLVGELNRAGLVERREDDDDRRRTIVSVGEEHRKEIEPWTREILSPMRQALEQLPAAKRAGFMEGLRALAAASAAVPGVGSPGDC